jgi:hypothetical protein
VIWLFDVGDLDKALEWADIAIAQHQATPERLRSNFQRLWPIRCWPGRRSLRGAGKALNRIFTHV